MSLSDLQRKAPFVSKANLRHVPETVRKNRSRLILDVLGGLFSKRYPSRQQEDQQQGDDREFRPGVFRETVQARFGVQQDGRGKDVSKLWTDERALPLLKGVHSFRRILNNYLVWQTVRSLTAYLSKPFRDAYKGLRKALIGSEGREEQWRYCVSDTNNAMGFAIGAMFVREVFRGKSKPMVNR